MTKKHFKMLAALLKQADEQEWTIEHFTIELCPLLKQQNPNFDSGRFLGACGFGGY